MHVCTCVSSSAYTQSIVRTGEHIRTAGCKCSLTLVLVGMIHM